MRHCFMIGHRDAPDTIHPQIRSAIMDCLKTESEYEFIVGGYGRFDSLAARAVIELKQENPQIRLTLLQPYLTAKPLPRGFDGALFPPDMEFVPRRAAIVRANRYAIKICDTLIVYAVHPASNAWNLRDYAQPRVKKGELRLICLSDAE